MVIRRWLAVVLVAVSTTSGCGSPTARDQAGVWPATSTLAAEAAASGAAAAEQDAVVRFYTGRSGPAWIAADGSMTPAGREMTAALRAAATEGLAPADYLPRGDIDGPARDGRATTARRDVAISLGALRYMHDLHLGRVDPRTIGLRLTAWDEPHDFVHLLAGAVADGDVSAMLDRLSPPFPIYRGLVGALRRYRELAGAPPAPPAPRRTIEIGDALPGATDLRARLAAFGDLTASGAMPVDTYDAATADAVAHFQRRHGIQADGRLGPRTIAALQVSPADRAVQIVLALERLRWLPDLGGRRTVAVNIPMFQLAAWEAGRLGEPPAFTMGVIVGRAAATETPVFVETMDHLIFRPYWNVPPSILDGEVLPAVRKDPGYLARERMEIVDGQGDGASVVPETPAALEALAHGSLRVRQRPGRANALGLVKFVFPNRESVYMHGTPATELFARDRRDFSHGCIRVADPPRLAEWALQGVPGWTGARVAEAMAGADNTRVDLAEPIDVVLFYLTAAIDPATGDVVFAEDIYGRDAVLARALEAPRQPPGE
ncbi:MAG: L,D-transpeptidase family protein [Vicinamibacterales bacterium]